MDQARFTQHWLVNVQMQNLTKSSYLTIGFCTVIKTPYVPLFLGITGILMSAAGLPVCLTRPPKLVLHPPPVSKSDIKPVPGLGHCCRKTTKKQARKGVCSIVIKVSFLCKLHLK